VTHRRQTAIERRRRVLRAKAMALGRRLYALKPVAMTARLGRGRTRSRSR
jgi:hypothetical protein